MHSKFFFLPICIAACCFLIEYSGKEQIFFSHSLSYSLVLILRVFFCCSDYVSRYTAVHEEKQQRNNKVLCNIVTGIQEKKMFICSFIVAFFLLCYIHVSHDTPVLPIIKSICPSVFLQFLFIYNKFTLI